MFSKDIFSVGQKIQHKTHLSWFESHFKVHKPQKYSPLFYPMVLNKT